MENVTFNFVDDLEALSVFTVSCASLKCSNVWQMKK